MSLFNTISLPVGACCLLLFFTVCQASEVCQASASNGGVCSVSPSLVVLPDSFSRKVVEPLWNTTVRNSRPFIDLDCTFQVYDRAFLEVLGKDPKLRTLASKDYSFAHEAGVYLSNSNEVFFTSNRLTDRKTNNTQYIELWKVNVATGALTQVISDPPVPMANGGTNYGDGEVALCVQGSGADLPGGIARLNPTTGDWSYIVNNWFGLAFNSPNDVVVAQDGALWFTDPAYGFPQGFKPEPQLGDYVWRYVPGSGPAQIVVAEGLGHPNGIAFANNEKTVLVSDTGFFNGTGALYNPARGHAIYAWDLTYEPDGSNHRVAVLTNKRLFAVTDVGIPDGIKLDTRGNVYAGAGDGVQVFSPGGRLIGKINVPGGVANLVFAADGELVILAEERVLAVKLNTRGALLHL